MDHLLSTLHSKLSAEALIITPHSTTDFEAYLKRWSDADLQSPGAIVVVASEEDVVETVKLASTNKITFVPTSGGHSPWSTIGADGFVLDMRKLNIVSVDSKAALATVEGGALARDVVGAISPKGFCCALGSAGSVGYIPFVTGGGMGILSPMIGFGSDNLVSAKLVTASGDLLSVSSTNEPDLFWAIRGAGQFFGVVTEVVVKIHPLNILGNPDGRHWMSTYIFPIERAEEVCNVMKELIEDRSHLAAGTLVIATLPPAFKLMLISTVHYFGSQAEGDAIFKPLANLGPFKVIPASPLFQNMNDALKYLEVKGDYKTNSLVGVEDFKTETWLEVIETYKAMRAATGPDGGNSAYFLEWTSRAPPTQDTAFAHHNVRAWANFVSWFKDPQQVKIGREYEAKAVEAVRKGVSREGYRAYGNVHRSGPLEHRYSDSERVEKLKNLKAKWDPTGVFTHQLL